MNENIYPIVVDSDGGEHVSFDILQDTVDMVGRPIRIAINQLTIETPFGSRAVTTAYIFMKNGDKSVYSGSTIQSPADGFSYKSAVIWALIRAGEDYVGRRWSKDSVLNRFVVDARGNAFKRIKAWANHFWRKLVYDTKSDPDELESRLKTLKDGIAEYMENPAKMKDLGAKLAELDARAEEMFKSGNVSDQDAVKLIDDLMLAISGG